MFVSRVVNTLLNSKLASSFIAIKLAQISNISKYKFFIESNLTFFGTAFSGQDLESLNISSGTEPQSSVLLIGCRTVLLHDVC